MVRLNGLGRGMVCVGRGRCVDHVVGLCTGRPAQHGWNGPVGYRRAVFYCGIVMDGDCRRRGRHFLSHVAKAFGDQALERCGRPGAIRVHGAHRRVRELHSGDRVDLVDGARVHSEAVREGAVIPACGVSHVKVLALLAACVAMGGCTGGKVARAYTVAVNGNPQRGERLIEWYGCGACHTIPGISSAQGVVGPPLFFFGRRTMIAGELPNTPANLERWIENAPAIEPKTAMPNLGVGDEQARDIAAYLYTLR